MGLERARLPLALVDRREAHRARVMEKMGAKSLAQLVRMAMDLGKAGAA